MTFDSNLLLTVEELTTLRSPTELADWVEHKCRLFADHKETKQSVLLHKGLYKKFYEEIYPLSLFETYLCSDIQCIPIERRISNAIVRVKKGAVQIAGCIRAREAEKQPSSRSHLIIHPSVRPEYLDGRWPRCS